MEKRKGMLQKFSSVMAIVSFLLAIVTAVLLYFRLDSGISGNPISVSLMASVIFFISVGVILFIMGKVDLPSFKFEDPDTEGK